jgi:ATP-dependent protease Clp ATPase subunit
MWWRKKPHHPGRRVMRCSFCDKWEHDVQKLIAGPKIFICEECVKVCNAIIADDNRFLKSTGATRRKAEEPLSWPNAVRCALCHVEIRGDDSIVIPENRGTLCIDCVQAVATARHSALATPSRRHRSG